MGTAPKTLGFFVILRLRSRFAAVAALKRRGRCVAATFGVAAQEIYFTSVRFRLKAKVDGLGGKEFVV